MYKNHNLWWSTFIAIIFLTAITARAQAQLNPFTAVAGPESSFGTNLQNPISSASGIFGMLNSTFQANLAAIGGNPAQYPTAASAPPSVQFAVFAQLYNTRGFADYTCPNCDAVLTQEILNNGGIGAYQAPGTLSTNPASYTALNAPGAVGAYFATPGNTGGSFVGSAPIGGGAGGAAPAAAASLTTNPFQYVYSSLVDGVTSQIDTALQATLALVRPYLVSMLTIAVAFLGARTMAGQHSFEGFMGFAVRATVVGVLLSPDGHFGDWIRDPILQLPTILSSAFGVPQAGPAAIFDDAIHTLSAIDDVIQSNVPSTIRGFGNSLASDVLWLLGAGSFMIMFAPYLLASFLLLLMIAVAPVPIAFGVFRSLDKWALGFADVVATLALTLLAVDIVISLIQGVIVEIMTGFTPGGSSRTDLAAFGTLVLVMIGIALSLKYLGPLVARISGGVSLAVEGAGAAIARSLR